MAANTPSPSIIVVGSHAPGLFLRVRRIPLPGETVIGWDYQEPIDGGKGTNQAIAAARLGARTAFVGCFGKDRIGLEGERWLREAGVDTSHLAFSETTASGIGFIMLDENSVPAMVTSMGANAEVSREQAEGALEDFQGARVLLTQFEIDPETALLAAQAARKRGMIAIVNPAPAARIPLDRFRGIDFLTPNESEARALLGLKEGQQTTPDEMARALRDQSGAKCVLITLGEQGAILLDGDGSEEIPAPRVNVVDTSGAGDAFCAALAVGLINGFSSRQSARWACRAAALSVTRTGTIPAFPNREEVERFISILGS